MASYIEMIFCDSSGAARKTGVGAAMATNALTRQAFNSYRELEDKEGNFLCDYYNSKGDLSDTIQINAKTFTRITGEKVKTEQEYIQIDKNYWKKAKALSHFTTNHKEEVRKPTYYAWLIETRDNNGVPSWLCNPYMPEFTTNAWDALHFGRKTDAEAYADSELHELYITEHAFTTNHATIIDRRKGMKCTCEHYPPSDFGPYHSKLLPVTVVSSDCYMHTAGIDRCSGRNNHATTGEK